MLIENCLKHLILKLKKYHNFGTLIITIKKCFLLTYNINKQKEVKKTGNTFGKIFRVTACGESYGKALLTNVDGVHPGLELTNGMIQEELDKRKPWQSALDSPRKETDAVDIVSGMLDGYTTGAPVGMTVYNVDCHDIHVKQYRDMKEQIRPGHTEYTFLIK